MSVVATKLQMSGAASECVVGIYGAIKWSGCRHRRRRVMKCVRCFGMGALSETIQKIKNNTRGAAVTA